MIPKIIHYCWFGGAPIPRNVKKCIESWKKFCPHYEIKLWTEHNFDIYSHPFLKDAYISENWAFVSDYARLRIVYDNGGIYLDTDVELIRNIDELLVNRAFFALQQPGDFVATGLGFGAQKGNTAVKAMLDEYDKVVFSADRKRELACPILNTKALEPLGYLPNNRLTDMGDFVVYPPEYFDPQSVGDAIDLLSENTYSIHHYSASWETFFKRSKRLLINKIGQDKILFLKKILRRK